MGKIIKSYFFWTYPRGSFHYDVMVTLILAFLFLSPLVINYHDRPLETFASNGQVLVKADGENGLIYDFESNQLPASLAGHPDAAALKAELSKRVTAISGSVVIDGYSALKDATGRVIEYRVWAHRGA